MLYKILNQTHKCYNELDLRKKALLYKGGDEIIKNAGLFIHKRLGENENAYKQRLAEASYINYFAAVIDYFTASIFSKDLSITAPNNTGFYDEFSRDADLRGNAFVDMLKDVFRQAMVTGDGFLGIDFPTSNIVPETMEQQEYMNLSRAYLYHIDEKSIINWGEDHLDNLSWVVLKKEESVQDSPFDPQDRKKISFKVWTMQNGFAKWQVFSKTYEDNQEPKDKDDYALEAEGVTSFKQIPILRFYTSEGLYIGNKIGTLCSDHFAKRSSLFFAQNRSLYAMPYFKQGAEVSGNDLSVIAEDPNRGAVAATTFAQRGFLVLGPDDEVGFAEPKGTSYDLVNTQLKELVDEIYRTAGQLSQSVSSTNTYAKSALSKAQDNKSMEMILNEFGQLLKKFALKVYKVVSEARFEDIDFVAQGLSGYQNYDKTELIAEATALSEGMIQIPSVTFKKIHLNKLATSLVENISPELQLQIEEEINQFVDDNKDELLDTEMHKEEKAVDEATDIEE